MPRRACRAGAESDLVGYKAADCDLTFSKLSKSPVMVISYLSFKGYKNLVCKQVKPVAIFNKSKP